MSLRHAGPWHYEYIANRSNGRKWRVADEDDDVVTDFPTEAEAAECVRMHNARVNTDPNWRYG